tara:strand:- start:1 stop:180 length:180 start_codon:yes stop_codon:yes gene_type:complete
VEGDKETEAMIGAWFWICIESESESESPEGSEIVAEHSIVSVGSLKEESNVIEEAVPRT